MGQIKKIKTFTYDNVTPMLNRIIHGIIAFMKMSKLSNDTLMNIIKEPLAVKEIKASNT